MDKELDKSMLIDIIEKGIKSPIIKEINIINLELYTKIAELELINSEGDEENDIVYINHIIPKEISESGKKEYFSSITLKISKLNVFKNVNNKLVIKFNGNLNYRQRSGYKGTIELNNKQLTLKTFKELYDYEEFLKEMEKVIEDANTQIVHLLENQGVKI